MNTALCSSCNSPMRVLTGASLYLPAKLHKTKYLACVPCDMRVTLDITGNVMGTVAPANLRRSRQRVHRHMVRYIKESHRDKKSTYAWLGAKMRLPGGACHVALFDTAQCVKAMQILRGER